MELLTLKLPRGRYACHCLSALAVSLSLLPSLLSSHSLLVLPLFVRAMWCFWVVWFLKGNEAPLTLKVPLGSRDSRQQTMCGPMP